MGSAYEVLDGPRARKNGVCQMVVGSLCIVFNAIIFILMAEEKIMYLFEDEQLSGAGIWGGVFHIFSGSLIFVASSRRSRGYIIWALVVNVLSMIVSLPHVAFMSISIMSRKREILDGWGLSNYRTNIWLFR